MTLSWYNKIMEPISKSEKFSVKPKRPAKNRYLHSPDHLLADELSQKLHDPKHFGFYLKIATLHDHNFLRNLAGQILENPNVKTPGKLFAFLIKKHHEESQKKNDSPHN